MSHFPTSWPQASTANIVRIAQAAEELNYSALWTYERLLRAAAADAGRDRSTLSVVLRANVPVTPEPIESGRPFLGGSPGQIAADIERIADLAVDQVFFANGAPIDIDTQVGVWRPCDQVRHRPRWRRSARPRCVTGDQCAPATGTPATE